MFPGIVCAHVTNKPRHQRSRFFSFTLSQCLCVKMPPKKESKKESKKEPQGKQSRDVGDNDGDYVSKEAHANALASALAAQKHKMEEQHRLELQQGESVLVGDVRRRPCSVCVVCAYFALATAHSCRFRRCRCPYEANRARRRWEMLECALHLIHSDLIVVYLHDSSSPVSDSA